MKPDRSEHHPGYGFHGPDGQWVSVPPAKITPAAEYKNEAMTRERALDVMIAFGFATGFEVPIRLRPNGPGFDALVPMEFIESWSGLQKHLRPKRS